MSDSDDSEFGFEISYRHETTPDENLNVINLEDASTQPEESLGENASGDWHIGMSYCISSDCFLCLVFCAQNQF